MWDSTENSGAIFIRGGEPWVMGYCWRIQKCPNWCIPPAFLEGKKAWETYTRKRPTRTLKEIRQQYPPFAALCPSGPFALAPPKRSINGVIRSDDVSKGRVAPWMT